MIETIHDLKPDGRNANKGTDRGKSLLADSLTTLGAGRSIVCDRNGKVIGGNKTLEQALALGLEITPVTTKGDRLVVVIREDLDLDTDPKARSLALADNRIAELDLDWDAEQVLADMETCELDGLWTEAESTLLASLAKEEDDPFDDFQDSSDRTVDIKPQNASCTIGEYRFSLEREQYLRWQEQLRQTVGFDEDDIIAEIQRRLKL